ncbi:toxin-antitoxin system YwqK family antitoxin [Cryomorpha ignava]|uniref:Toxin-antitoxin system YwqK family antitoxin n=1 Tax=Cryomorpha ignava TaxID=101383 RepID=A0A7K3WU11_9FLAO|nr:toxin-antitoxin system YwqK family antitoxin [Cryomorpha ignava]NEN24521.1 toxin-antitoxin system YwqK family antitoxin [Cryomorpha ignava]
MSKTVLVLLILIHSCAQSPKGSDNSENGEATCIALSETESTNGLTYYHMVPLSGKICSWYPNGNKHTETAVIEGKKEGIWTVYFENGQPEKTGSILNGEDDGEYKEYYKNGQLKYDYTYKNGSKEGVWKSWYEGGGKYTERNFSENTLDGKVLVWDEQGRLAKEYDYVNGTLIKQQMHFKEWE